MKTPTKIGLALLIGFGLGRVNWKAPEFNPIQTTSFETRPSPHALGASYPSAQTLPGRPVYFGRVETDSDSDLEAFALYEDGSIFFNDGPLVGHRNLTYTKIDRGSPLYNQLMASVPEEDRK